MSERTSQLPITTPDMLVAAFKANPPYEIVRDSVIDDFRAKEGETPNLFTSAAMQQRLDELFARPPGIMIVEHDAGEAVYFGEDYSVVRRIARGIHGIKVGAFTRYLPKGKGEFQFKQRGIYRPSHRMTLYGNNEIFGNVVVDLLKFMGPGDPVNFYHVRERGMNHYSFGETRYNVAVQQQIASILEMRTDL